MKCSPEDWNRHNELSMSQVTNKWYDSIFGTMVRFNIFPAWFFWFTFWARLEDLYPGPASLALTRS